jgi:uroporphyrinogen decarboxylase
MSTTRNDRLLRALRREPVDRTPVWIMRQAGRYLPEYRATRARAGDFMTLCKTPELACEVTLQPLARYALDAAILFSDILTIPDAMGLGLRIDEGVGPRFARRVETAADIARLATPDPESELRYVMDTVRLVRDALAGRVPLIGFAGSPWTLATYMVEGGGGHQFERAKRLIHTDPGAAHALLARLADAVAIYLNAQIAAGAEAVQIFDTWGGVLAHAAFHEFSLGYMRRVLEQLQRGPAGARIPVILFTKGGDAWLEAIAASGADAVGLDWTSSLGAARRRTGNAVALQGNLDPAVLRAPPRIIETQVAAVLADFGSGPGHVFNLGHGITPDIDPAHVGVMIDAVHALSPRYHAGAG